MGLDVSVFDTIDFHALAERFNVDAAGIDRRELFTRLVIDEIRRPGAPADPVVLDIGCGKGIAGSAAHQRRVAEAAGTFWGVEPDTSFEPQAGVFDRLFPATLEDADIPPASVDVAYCINVMEHVEHPAAFFEAVARALRPGGVFVCLTVSGGHYFAKITSALRALHLDEPTLWLLDRISGNSFQPDHYRVHYRCNSEASIRRAATPVGLTDIRLAFLHSTVARRYLPGPLKAIDRMWNNRIERLRRPEMLLTMLARCEKPQGVVGLDSETSSDGSVAACPA